jgi:hypothetical protein
VSVGIVSAQTPVTPFSGGIESFPCIWLAFPTGRMPGCCILAVSQSVECGGASVSAALFIGPVASPLFARPSRAPDKIQMMPRLLTADDIMPLVASLPDSERIKLLRRIASSRGTDGPVYSTAPPTRDEFSDDDEPMAWEADGWDEFR